MKILLVGGGSGGPVAPLIAVADAIKETHPKARFLLVGTKTGPEKLMASHAGLEFASITTGKWRRYFSLRNFATPVRVMQGFAESVKLLRIFRPDCVFGTGSFVQVPLIWAAKFLGIPVVIHQQDILPGLANRLCEYAATKITVSFADSLTDFSSGLGLFYKKNKNKIVLTGNPFRKEIAQPKREDGQKHFHLNPDFPTLLVLGGGTGAKFFNDLVEKALPELARFVQIIHSTGANKGRVQKKMNYQSYEFISDMGAAYAAADVVLARAGLSTITELSNLAKVSIIIPIPESHQELNAFLLYHEQAAIVLDQEQLTPQGLVRIVRKLLFEHALQKSLQKNISKIMPKNSSTKVAEIIVKLAEKT